MTESDDDWQWEVPPVQGTVSSYSGNDLSKAISVGSNVNALRSKAGLSAQDVEDYAGVKKADLLAIEAGLLVLNAELASQLAMVFGVSEDELRLA